LNSEQNSSRIKYTLDTGHKDPNSGQSSSILAMWSPYLSYKILYKSIIKVLWYYFAYLAVGYCQGFNMLAALILEVMEGNVEDSLKVGIRD
jgi:hypothetical protein